MSDVKLSNFVTIVTVGTKQKAYNENANSPDYVTVLTIGDGDKINKPVKDVVEEVVVYRLPGEKLGFGLKFEGGTKANEFVERLFIQSCAADSPASNVKSSWGKLSEGDEVLEIDTIPVNSMTRVDCVRQLKDSNVAIKLVVRHVFEQSVPKPISTGEIASAGSREEDKTPPPPPPIPPRKIPKKSMRNPPPAPPNDVQETDHEFNIRQTENPATPSKMAMPSPRSSTRYHVEVPRRERKSSDVEITSEFLQQESAQCLSESDDTGSTISTVIDRFGSFPPTTNSSFSGSLPSTPTPLQRHLDISNTCIHENEDPSVMDKILLLRKEENNNLVPDEGGPLCFHDAALSYGNENTNALVLDELVESAPAEEKFTQAPVVPTRSKDVNTEKDLKKNENLPRLVDFVPKTSNGFKEIEDTPKDIIQLLLDEQHRSSIDEFDGDKIDNMDPSYLYTAKWNMTSQLATIGEVEEESGSDLSFNRNSLKSTPLVIVESADNSIDSEKAATSIDPMSETEPHASDGIMATPPSDSRQPPDGDEFPDFIDADNEILKYSTSIGYRTLEAEKSLNTMQDLSKNKVPESDNSTIITYRNNFEGAPIHTRSQSLINLSSINSNEKPELKSSRWNDLVEQRRKSLSKLKGLVIPESKETDIPPIDSAVSIPEIKNLDTAAFSIPKINNLSQPPAYPATLPKNSAPVTSWTSNTTSSIPKYSPAFKRKSLHVYTSSINKNEQNQDMPNTETIKYCDKSSLRPNKLTDDDLNPPKSLESISSPTRSDCSFDYVTGPKKNSECALKTPNKIEDESDNDSAVSSSQSSFNSRFSPPPSPTKSFPPNPFKRKTENDRSSVVPSRYLSATSTEAINRRNILASAKCSSGNNLPNMETPTEPPPLPPKKEKVVEIPPVKSLPPIEKVKPVKDSSDVKSDSSLWQSKTLTPVKTTVPEVRMIKREFAKSTESISELGKALRPIPPSSPSRNYLSKDLTGTKWSQSPTKEINQLGAASSFLSSRKSQPISVKALTQNFEKFGATAPPLPQKTIVSKPQIPTRSVRNEILNVENKITVSTDSIPKSVVSESVPKPRFNKTIPAEVRNSQECLTNEKASDKHRTETITLKLINAESVLGIALIGGTDENSDIMIHRIRYGSVAYQDGRLMKGDTILSINGKPTKGLSYAEAVELLKEQTSQFIIERQVTDMVSPVSGNLQRRSSSLLSIDSKSLTNIATAEIPTPKTPTNVISFTKDGSGLGFSIEGGKDSPQGDVPLVIKKIFTGGAAEKNGELATGDEIVFVNDINFTYLTRMEAWNMMKKIPDGMVKIQIYRKS